MLLPWVSSQNIGYAQEEIIQVDTELVKVPVTVLDRDGRYITNLRKEDFQVFDNDVEQEITFYETNEQPVTVLLLLDNSGSMTSFIPELVRAANVFVSQLRSNDSLIAATFAGAGKVDLLFQAAKVSEIVKGIKIRPYVGDGTTTTYDAVDFALRKMKKIKGRKAIILFSDAELHGIYSTAEENLSDAEEGESLIYTIRFGSLPANIPGYKKESYLKWFEKTESYLQGLAVKTGGRAFKIKDIFNLEKTFKEVAKELSQQFSLGYYPKTEGKKVSADKLR